MNLQIYQEQRSAKETAAPIYDQDIKSILRENKVTEGKIKEHFLLVWKKLEMFLQDSL